ncbi:MAG: ABC transporter ATP-binding protein, partial [Thermomicrobiaceae bacterium]|nr:ABC transporter ATP-binding protein [Thermomicrobiaceae bacterium]
MPVLRRILSYLRPYRARVVIAYVALLLGIAMQLSIPRLIEYVVDGGLVERDRRVVLVGSVAIVAAGLLQAGFTFVRSYLFQFIAERVAYDIRNELYAHMQRLSFSFYDRANTGQLMSRATEDVNSIRRFLMTSLRSIVQVVGTVVVVAVILLLTDWRLALISLSVVPVLAWTAIRFGRLIRPRFLLVQQQFGAMTNVLQENLAGARVVRAFAREEDESARFERSLQDLYDAQMDTVRSSARYFPLMTALSSLGVALILWYGGRQVLSGSLSIGKLTAFYFYLALLAQPVRLLGWVVNSLARALASGERIFEILDTRPRIASPARPAPVSRLEGRLEFRHVSFQY